MWHKKAAVFHDVDGDLTTKIMLPAHFQGVNGDVVTKLGITVASCYALCSLVALVSYSCFARYCS